MMGLVLGVAVAVVLVAWILHPVLVGRHAPTGRDDRELTEVQHRKRMALLALRDVEYDYHAGKLDEGDYGAMKRDISSEALEALDAEALEAERRRTEKICGACGEPGPGDHRFCRECGAALGAPPDAWNSGA